MENEAPFVVLKLEEHAETDPGHSTLTVHGDEDVVAGVAAAVALMLAAIADEVGGDLLDASELNNEESSEGESLAESA